MGAFSYHRFIFLLACINRWKVYNRLITACTAKTAIEVQCLCASTSKVSLLSGVFVSHHFFLFACAASNRANLAFKTIIIEDTHITLAVIPFKVGVNNSLNFFCHYKHTTEKLPSLHSCKNYNSLKFK